jgi:hypothetical protein
MFRNLIALLIASSLAVTATAQETRPAETPAAADAPSHTVTVAPEDRTPQPPQPQPPQRPWPKLVETFARSLVAGNVEAVDAALVARPLIHRFDTAMPNDAQQLANRLAGSTVVGQHAYVHPPLVMAADIAADFKNAVGIPDKAKARFLVDDEHDIKKANTTAAKWVAEELEVSSGTPVGVIVLWTPRPAAPGAAATAADVPPAYDVTFVLCRGDEVAPGEFKVNTVIYGAPVPDAP